MGLDLRDGWGWTSATNSHIIIISARQLDLRFIVIVPNGFCDSCGGVLGRTVFADDRFDHPSVIHFSVPVTGQDVVRSAG